MRSICRAVYLSARELRPGDARGVGRVVDLLTKGWLPYTLRWRFTVTDARGDATFALEARGDFVGRGVWTFSDRDGGVDAVYDWRVRADKPLLRRLSWLLRPAFSANHRWAMATGERSLRIELARRQAGPGAAAQLPPPPGPTLVWASRVREWWARRSRRGDRSP